MKRITTIFGLLAIVLNAAMGFTGAMLFCEHESGDSHLVTSTQHSGLSHEISCHSQSAPTLRTHGASGDCDSCIDTEMGGGDSQNLLRSSGLERVPAPQVVTTEFSGFDLAESLTPIAEGLLPLTRAPPEVESLTALQVKLTVLRL